LANPVDIHYKGQLLELGVRVTDALEMEQAHGPIAQINLSLRKAGQ
jgi:hypothetical protein